MNVLDFLIIYLTCGAPLGVFYFLQNRRKRNDTELWLKTFFTFFFWLPFGFILLRQSKANKKFFVRGKIFSKDEKTKNEIFLFQKQMEKVFEKSDLQISIFEFREIVERYVGLTLAGNSESFGTTDSEKEIFRIANGVNVEIGSICLNRRNLKRLTFHQIRARQDFSQIINQLFIRASDKEKFAESAIAFFQLINDTEALPEIEKSLFDNLPNKRDFALRRSENFLWNTETRKSPLAKSTAIQLQSLTATVNSSAKD